MVHQISNRQRGVDLTFEMLLFIDTKKTNSCIGSCYVPCDPGINKYLTYCCSVSTKVRRTKPLDLSVRCNLSGLIFNQDGLRSRYDCDKRIIFDNPFLQFVVGFRIPVTKVIGFLVSFFFRSKPLPKKGMKTRILTFSWFEELKVSVVS